MAFKISKVGNSAGIILPKDVLARMNVGPGDTLTGTLTPGGIELRPEEPDFEAQMAVARDVMARRRRALQELAK